MEAAEGLAQVLIQFLVAEGRNSGGLQTDSSSIKLKVKSLLNLRLRVGRRPLLAENPKRNEKQKKKAFLLCRITV
jgi:hypothetical protein